MKLILHNTRPPIPTRAFDWICYEDGSEDGLHGYGTTAQEALENWQEYHEERARITRADIQTTGEKIPYFGHMKKR